jgi:hypothetical protein
MLRLKTQRATRKGTMQKKILILILFFLQNSAFSLEKTEEITFEKIPYKNSIKESILSGDVFSESKVNDFEEQNKKMQSLQFSIAGYHKKSCNYALKTLSNYENYHKYISFITESLYNEPTEEISFRLSHVLLPYDMLLVFKLPRITKEGTYPFSFDIGFLKGLTGKIHVINYKNRCLFYSTANWKGQDTGFNALIFEVFSQALSKLSMETLFRISSTLTH